MGARRLSPAVLVLCVVAALATGASASHNFTEHVSTGPSGGNGAFDAFYRGTSSDGVRAFFETNETLVAGDTDSQFDVYERNGSTTTLLSIGPGTGNGAFEAVYQGNSTNGIRVFFTTREQLVAGDTDAFIDVYERNAGTTTLISTGTTAVCPVATCDATFRAASDDGTRVFFQTRERLEAGDTDSSVDVYQRMGSTTTRITSGAINGNGAFGASFADVSADGTRVLFDSREQLVAGDTDALLDLYERVGATTTRISTGPTSVNPADAFFAGASSTGTRVFFHTTERMVAGDTDSSFDIYERNGATTTHISTGGNGAFDALLQGMSSDGTRVFFETSESLAGTDTDTSNDVYERFSGTTSHLSRGPTSAPGSFPASYRGASANGLQVYFESSETLVAADTDSQADLYERSGVTTTQISTGPDGGNGPFPAGFDVVASDGSRVLFHTDESLVAADTDSFNDVYERSGSATTIVSGGLVGGNGNFFADFNGASADASRVYFHTDEKLTNGDNDVAGDCDPDTTGTQNPCQDIYVASIAAPFARPGSGTPLRVPLVLAYAQCTSPNVQHVGPKLSPGPGAGDPSCSPPVRESSQLTTATVGTGTASVKLTAVPGNNSTPADEADIGVEVHITDVVKASDSSDYVGYVLPAMTLRITDRASGSAQTTQATVADTTFSAPVVCTGTGPAIGSSCDLTTTTDTLVPGFAREGKRAMLAAVRIEVKDAGPDGDVIVAGCPPTCGTGDETVYLREGVFTP